MNEVRYVVRHMAIATVAGLLGLLATACDDDLAGATTTTAGEGITTYETVFRESAEVGDVVYILVPPGEHTESDLDSFVRGLLAEDAELWGIEVFDDPEGVEAGLSRLLTATDIALLEEHHLISVIDREVIRFRGPFADLGEHSLDG